MAFTVGAWEGGYTDNGDNYTWSQSADFSDADAAAFVAYWNTVLVKTVTANCTCIATEKAANVQTISITEPDGALTIHENVLDDIDTTETALVTRTTDMDTADTAADTYATSVGVTFAIRV